MSRMRGFSSAVQIAKASGIPVHPSILTGSWAKDIVTKDAMSALAGTKGDISVTISLWPDAALGLYRCHTRTGVWSGSYNVTAGIHGLGHKRGGYRFSRYIPQDQDALKAVGRFLEGIQAARVVILRRERAFLAWERCFPGGSISEADAAMMTAEAESLGLEMAFDAMTLSDADHWECRLERLRSEREASGPDEGRRFFRTDATARLDGFGTRQIGVTNPDGFRTVSVLPQHLDWQLMKYRSILGDTKELTRQEVFPHAS